MRSTFAWNDALIERVRRHSQMSTIFKRASFQGIDLPFQSSQAVNEALPGVQSSLPSTPPPAAPEPVQAKIQGQPAVHEVYPAPRSAEAKPVDRDWQRLENIWKKHQEAEGQSTLPQVAGTPEEGGSAMEPGGSPPEPAVKPSTSRSAEPLLKEPLALDNTARQDVHTEEETLIQDAPATPHEIPAGEPGLARSRNCSTTISQIPDHPEIEEPPGIESGPGAPSRIEAPPPVQAKEPGESSKPGQTSQAPGRQELSPRALSPQPTVEKASVQKTAQQNTSIQRSSIQDEADHTEKPSQASLAPGKKNLQQETKQEPESGGFDLHAVPLHEAWPVQRAAADIEVIPPLRSRPKQGGSQPGLSAVPENLRADIQASEEPRPAGLSAAPAPTGRPEQGGETPQPAGERSEQTGQAEIQRAPAVEFIETEIGPLPGDLWRLIGQEPPVQEEQAGSRQGMPDQGPEPPRSQTAPGEMPSNVQSSQQQPAGAAAIPAKSSHSKEAREAPVPEPSQEVQRLSRETFPDSGQSMAGGEEEAPPSASFSDSDPVEKSGLASLDLDDLVNQVYQEIKRRLSREWERFRT